jgi:glycosyltransferase involved in cell wall biosynthesis
MERHLDTVARGLARLGHDVTVVTTAHPDGTIEASVDGVQTLYLPGSTWRRYQRGWWRNSWDVLQRSHARAPYAAILSESAGALGYVDDARRRLGLSTVVVLQGSARSELVTAWRGARTPRGVYRLGRGLWRVPVMTARWRRAAGAVSRFLAVSPEVERSFAREARVDPARMAVVPNGLDTDRFRPDPQARERITARLGLRAEVPLLVTASRLEFEKGIHVALGAAARLRERHRDVHLVVSGRGRHEHTLRQRASALGLDGAVTFTGLLDHGDLADLLAASDVCMLPSLRPEGLPLVAVEAQACGVPVVASHVDGTDAAVADGVTGFLVPRGSPDDLARALETLLDDSGRREQMGRAARARAVERFDQAAMVRATESALRVAATGG